jgi:hypothetical protein
MIDTARPAVMETADFPGVAPDNLVSAVAEKRGVKVDQVDAVALHHLEDFEIVAEDEAVYCKVKFFVCRNRHNNLSKGDNLRGIAIYGADAAPYPINPGSKKCRLTICMRPKGRRLPQNQQLLRNFWFHQVMQNTLYFAIFSVVAVQ